MLSGAQCWMLNLFEGDVSAATANRYSRDDDKWDMHHEARDVGRVGLGGSSGSWDPGWGINISNLESYNLLALSTLTATRTCITSFVTRQSTMQSTP